MTITKLEVVNKFVDEGYGDKVIKDILNLQYHTRTNCYDYCDSSIEEKTSLSRLIYLKNNFPTLNKARDIEDNDNRITIERHPLQAFEGLFLKNYNFNITGFFWYPINGYCGWHTNLKDGQGDRTYVAWAEEDNKSFFRYYDEDKKELVTKWDKKGFNFHTFNITQTKPLWHCVGSKTNRISIGFNLQYDNDGTE
tara:strand:+ start:116 stop:700 length:585 start_codon:yes stop_codon:yes gene_type:complete